MPRTKGSINKIQKTNEKPIAKIINKPVFDFKRDVLKVEKLDFIGAGLYNLQLKGGTNIEVSLDEGEKSIIEALTRTGIPDFGTSQDVQKSEGLDASAIQPQLEVALRSPLDRNVGHWQNIKPKDSTMSLYWPKENQVGNYRQLGYRIALPEEIQDYELVLGSYNPGAEMNPSSPINYMGHVLMITTKANKKAIQNYDYTENRDMNYVQDKTVTVI